MTQMTFTEIAYRYMSRHYRQPCMLPCYGTLVPIPAAHYSAGCRCSYLPHWQFGNAV